MLRFEYDGPSDAKVTNKHAELVCIRDGFTVMIWDTKVGVIETYVFDDGRPTVWYFSAKTASADAWWRKILTVGENTAVAARWIYKRVKRLERKGESARLANDFILCLEEMKCSDKHSATWECAQSDARDRLADLCDLVGVPAEEVIGSDI